MGFLKLKKISRNILFIIIFFSLSSCKSIKEVLVPVETIKVEKEYSGIRDSIEIRDSIITYINGDTVRIYKEHIEYRNINKTDTVEKIDSIEKIVKVEVEVEKEVNKIYWWQTLLMWLGGILAILTILYVLYKIKIK